MTETTGRAATLPAGSILGTRVLRSEDPGFLTRGAVYTDDLVDERLAGAVHATFVRSPVAHARIVAIDTSEAAAAPGVVAVLTADDLAGEAPPQPPLLPVYPAAMAQPLLAHDVVRFVGEPVAVVLTEERYQGEDAAELVSVDYDPLPVLVDPKEAQADEVLLFPEVGSNTAFSSAAAAAAAAAGGGDDLTGGDDLAAAEEATDYVPAAASDPLDECEVVVTQEVVNQRVAVAPLEVRAAAAAWEGGRLTLWFPNQGAQGSKRSVQDMLGLDDADVRLITPDVGGAFGAKFGADVEYVVVALAARLLGRPATWVETRSENMVAMTHGRAQVQTVRIGGDRDGRIRAYRLEVLQDSGAYPKFGALLPSLTALMAPGVYDIPSVETSFVSVVTNTTPVGAYRGAGRPEATAAIERAVDLFAAEIGMDPAEVRRINLVPPFTEPWTSKGGAVYDSGDYPAALEAVLEAADYAGLRAEQAARRERGDVRQLGLGLSTYVEITGAGTEAGAPNENARLEVHPDGSATILTGTSPHGQGHSTVWAMLASEELGIPVERITVRWGDTDLVPRGGGTGGSRSLQQGGTAVRQAAGELVELARQRAARQLEVDAADLVVDLDRAGLRVAGVPGAGMSFAELAGEEPLFVHSVFSAPGPTYPFGAHVAVVEVDVESGKAELVRLVALDDAGVVINPLIAEGQRHGGLAQGAAQALLEEVLYDADGNPQTTTLADYPIVSATELPSFELVASETPTSYNPLGAKGIGEAGTIGATPAVQNAVVDAVAHLGVRHVDMPTSPMRVWRAVQAARGAG
ncbi:xanthine dehydrogenase family protein molybdopterin-binding subunit [Geodermatophilus sp. TF02-6]|uniref:xanthine dehydrogenase family protein molybdopterin-binding subunit n=1 Tax=Geodermatophilus sp. TF02-6 TaxID=2250575 RepID=UPI000DE90EA2|nr:xanthine dehydrogenase family protein molybdopterin-binding subunit [Geodermatophilus sp. TF02-6]RBY82396.1 xanthine dehydrogenase family protein molybdopterin-binding subunit [Geodermatophilus sp. TF02-6]